MPRRTIWAGAALGAGLAASAVSCSTSDCFGVHPGDRIAITLIDTYSPPGEHVTYDAGRADICGFGFDLSQGQTLVAQDSENIMGDDGVCKGAVATYEPFGNWTWTLSGTQSTSAQFILVGEYEGANGACTGHVQVNVAVTPGADPFGTYVPGQTPNVVLARDFSSDAPACAISCSGTFIVNLTRQ